jgi:hypothetical protein
MNLLKKSIALVALVGAITAFSTTRADAAFLTGTFSYVSLDASTDSDGDLTQATLVNVGALVFSGARSGSFTAIPVGSLMTHTDPLVFDPFAAQAPLWTVLGGTWTFDLLTAGVDFADVDTLVLRGTGIFHAPGFDATEGDWILTTQASGGSVGTFSVSQSVPEPLSLSLLGLGLAGVAIRRRRATR